MRFLADMGISQKSVAWLRAEGHDTVHLRDEQLQRLPDAEILEKAKKENRIILTCDLDFTALLAASQSSLPSVILFRLEDERPDNINRRLFTVISESSIALQSGAVISVDERKHRVRLLPIGK